MGAWRPRTLHPGTVKHAARGPTDPDRLRVLPLAQLHSADAYLDWAAHVPALLPALSGWRPPARRFSIRAVLRREYPGWLGAALALFLIEIGGDAFGGEPGPWIDRGWLALVLTVAVVVGVLRALKAWTGVLRLGGR